MKRIILSLFCALLVNNHVIASTTQTTKTTSKEKPVKILSIKQNVVLKFPLGLTDTDIAQWGKVNICEMGGGRWNFRGPVYSGGLGIKNTSWSENGGLQFAADAGLATQYEQIYVAKRIQSGYDVPDQHGCGPGW